MSAPAATYKFRRIASDSTGYYFDRWDRAIPIIVVASNEAEARKKARGFSGEPPSGHYWRFKLDRITELDEAATR